MAEPSGRRAKVLTASIALGRSTYRLIQYFLNEISENRIRAEDLSCGFFQGQNAHARIGADGKKAGPNARGRVQQAETNRLLI